MTRSLSTILIVILLQLLTVHFTRLAAADETSRLLGQYGGRCTNVAVQGDYAYLLEGNNLITLDVTNPATPQVTSRVTILEIPDDYPIFLKVSGDRLVIHLYPQWLVYDLSQPATPVLTSKVDDPDSSHYFGGIWTLEGDFLYHCAPDYETCHLPILTIWDLSDSAYPRRRSQTELSPTPDRGIGMDYQLESLAVSAGRAYLGLNNYLVVIDVSNPDHPVQLGCGSNGRPASPSGFPSGYCSNVTVRNNLAYASVYEYGSTFCFDITTPSTPTLMTSYTLPYTGGPIRQIIFNDNMMYVVRNWRCMDGDLTNGALQIIDLSDPAHPAEKYHTPSTWDDVSMLAAKGSWLFLADSRDGLKILNAADPAHPTVAATFQSLREARAIAVNDRRAYIMDRDDLRVLDISNYEAIKQVGSAAHITGLWGPLQLSGTALYNLNTTSGLSIIDISRPDAPKLASRLKTPGQANDLALEGRYAFIADGDRLQIVDVADPAHPRRLAFSDPALAAQKRYMGIAVKGGMAYLSDESNGLAIYNVSIPTAPQLVKRFPVENINGWLDVAVWDNWVALGIDHRNQAIIDVYRPETPILLYSTFSGSYYDSSSWQPNALAAERGLLFTKSSENRWHGAWEFYPPLQPFEQSFGFGGPTWHSSRVADFKLQNSIDFIANGDDGVYIAWVKNPHSAALPAWVDYP